MSETKKSVLFVHALTSLHPGSGAALGVVDLPVQRERHTQWPLIPASSLKGVLRDACRPSNDAGKPQWEAVFGPEKIEAGSDSSYAGALSFTDARILAFPVRSLNGVFAWVTCPAVLERLVRDLKLAGVTSAPKPVTLTDNNVATPQNPDLLVQGNQLVLEEYDFKATADGSKIAKWVAEHAVQDEDTKARLKSHLLVLPDNWFTHFVKTATEVVARIGLDYERKTVKKGALFYQEFLPPETLFYALAFAEKSRSPNPQCSLSAEKVSAYLQKHVKDGAILQFGGDETIGKGICRIRLMNGKEA